MMDAKMHHQTERGARIALAKKQISRESYEAILRGELSLADGKALGRGRGPGTPGGRSGSGAATEGPRRSSAEGRQERPQEGTDVPPEPASRISKDDTTQECWCGCQQRTSPGKCWKPGHDQRAKGIIKRAMRDGKVEELSPRLREYAKERGLI